MEEYDYGYEENPAPQKTIRGYQIIIIVLAVILAVLSFIYFKQMSNLKEDFAIERQELTEQFQNLMGDYDNLQIENDTINMQLAEQRHKADSIMDRLASERTLNRNKIRAYEKEIGTLRTVMQGYVHTIDSLNTLNRSLITENREFRQQVTSERLRAEKAEETAQELTTKVRQGSVVRARDIKLTPLSSNDREVRRASRAAQLRVDLMLSANELASPGERPIFVRITGPDNYLLANNAGAVFVFEDENRTYSAVRDIDYQNQDLGVSLYYKGSGIVSGNYKIEVYMDGYLIGSTEINLQ